jgi:hypothetical protein
MAALSLRGDDLDAAKASAQGTGTALAKRALHLMPVSFVVAPKCRELARISNATP